MMIARLLVALFAAGCHAEAAAAASGEDQGLHAKSEYGTVIVRSSAGPGWKVVIDSRRGGVITELRVPADGPNLASNDGSRFEGLCNVIYVDRKQPGEENDYIAKGSYYYYGSVEKLSVLEQRADRVVVEVTGRGGNQVSPKADVVRYRQRYTFSADRVVCEGEIEWLFDDIVSGSHPELIQLNSAFDHAAVAGEMRVWDQDSAPIFLPQTNSKGRNYPEGIDYPVTVEVPLRGGHALQFRSLEMPADVVQARFYWNEYPRQIEGKRGFAFKAWEGWPGNGAVRFPNDKPIFYKYEVQIAALKSESASAPSAKAAPPFAWQTATPESVGWSSTRLDAFRDHLAKHNTASFLLVRDDRIVYEWYAPNHSATKRHYSASMAKALVGGISVAVALNDSRLSLDDVAAKYIPEWRNDPVKSRIMIRQLGSHTSGLEDAEDGEVPHDKLTGWKGDFWKRLPPPRDPFTLSRDATPVILPLRVMPNSQNFYSNPGIAMLGYATTAALRDAPEKDLRTLLRERVMRPIGVADDEWSVGYDQTVTVDGLPLVAAWGGGGFTARATARLGRLMLRDGDWEGRQLIRPEAVRAVTLDAGTPGSGGIGWWSNNDGNVPNLPRDAFWGSGAGHQVLLVIPSLKVIAVRNGQNLAGPGDNVRNALFFQPLMEAIGAATSAATQAHPDGR